MDEKVNIPYVLDQIIMDVRKQKALTFLRS